MCGDGYFVILAAKYLPPMALVLNIISYFFPSNHESAKDGIYAMLFFGWLAAFEVCSAYTKLYKETHKDDLL